MIKMHKDTGCDGFMVGRGMLKNPWCLLEMSAYLNDQPIPDVTPLARQNLC